MIKNLKGSTLAGDIGARERVKNDYYATPPSATKQFLSNYEFVGVKTVLEPACGEGHMSNVLIDCNPNWEVTSTDLIDRGFGKGGVDFLKNGSTKYDLVITNPPFRYAEEFIRKALDISDRYVVMFAKLQLLESKARYKLFNEHPPSLVYVHSSRVNPFRNGSEVDEKGKPWNSTMAFAWFVWDKKCEKETRIRWLE